MSANEFQEALIQAEDSLIKALNAINTSRMQIALVVDESGLLNGVVTDGDIRRGILNGVGLEEEVRQVMNSSPVTARPGTTPEELLALMNNRSIKQVPLVDDDAWCAVVVYDLPFRVHELGDAVLPDVADGVHHAQWGH